MAKRGFPKITPEEMQEYSGHSSLLLDRRAGKATPV